MLIGRAEEWRVSRARRNAGSNRVGVLCLDWVRVMSLKLVAYFGLVAWDVASLRDLEEGPSIPSADALG